MTYDPTTHAAWLVKGETEFGPQRRCRECREWWPLLSDFWVPQAFGKKARWLWQQPCRGCQQPGRAEAAARYRVRVRRIMAATPPAGGITGSGWLVGC